MPREGYMAFFQLAFEKQEEMNQPLVSKNRFPFNNQITTRNWEGL